MRLNTVAGEYDGIYTSHVRNRDSGLLDSIAEFLEVARAGGTRAEISHLNVRHNTGAPERGWQRAVETMAAAREDGLDVLADTTPFRDGLGQLAGILPPWVAADGAEAALARLRDPDTRERLRDECDRYWRFIHKGEWDRVRLQASEQHPGLGRAHVRRRRRTDRADPWDATSTSSPTPARDTRASCRRQLFTDEHLAEMISHPLFCLGVDTYTRRSTPAARATSLRHPLGYAGPRPLPHPPRGRGRHAAARGGDPQDDEHAGGALRPLGPRRAAGGHGGRRRRLRLDGLDDVSTTRASAHYVAGSRRCS